MGTLTILCASLIGIIFFIFVILPAVFSLAHPETRWNWKKLDLNDLRFPPGFLWGTAAASHQVEGNCDNNNWSEWETQKDENGNPRIKNSEKAGLACDHWNRYKEDIALIKALGVKAYRLSVEWSKIEPEKGRYSEAALQHYRDVCDACIAEGIQPVVTLHHFTDPLWFYHAGGFEKEENIEAFVKFAEQVFLALSGRVKMWCTINECEVYCVSGYFLGIFPPGKKDAQTTANVMKNLMKAHVRVYRALKALPGGDQTQIGIVKNIFQMDPWRRWHIIDWALGLILNGIFNGSILTFFRTGKFKFSLPFVASSSFEDRGAPSTLDFIGLNYYSHLHLKFEMNPKQFFSYHHPKSDTMTDMDYTIYPEGFYRAIKEISTVGKPVFVTENGIADARDDRREIWIRRYLYAMSRAIHEGADVRGYFYWSFLDNFEWAEGYSMKFGLYSVDLKTQKRELREGSRAFVEIVQNTSR